MPVPCPDDLLDRFDARVIGHSHAKQALVAAMRMHLLPDNDRLGTPPRILLIGPRGVGKTTLGETLLAAGQIPSAKIDLAVPRCGASDQELSRIPAALEGQQSGVLFLDGLERIAESPSFDVGSSIIDPNAAQVDLLQLLDSTQHLLVFAAATIPEAISETAPQSVLRDALRGSLALLPPLVERFDAIIPVPRLSAAQVAKSFALSASPFARARRVIASLGGTFECDAASVATLARACAVSPVGAWTAARAVDRLLERVLRSPNPARRWRLS